MSARQAVAGVDRPVIGERLLAMQDPLHVDADAVLRVQHLATPGRRCQGQREQIGRRGRQRRMTGGPGGVLVEIDRVRLAGGPGEEFQEAGLNRYRPRLGHHADMLGLVDGHGVRPGRRA